MGLKKRHGGPPDADWVNDGQGDMLSPEFPLLLEFLTSPQYDDGSHRLPGSMSFFYESPGLKACLNDKDTGLIAFVTGPGFYSLLVALETGLREDRLDWRKGKDKRGKR